MNAGWYSVFVGVLVWSAIHPHDYFTWFLEVLPALLALPVLLATRRRFPLTQLAYWLLLWEFVLLMIGGHYTYAEVPLFDWIREQLHHGRNNYDKLAHLFQGFVPAIVAREIFLRLQVINGRIWLGFLVSCFCLALSASYELVEWLVAEFSGTSAEAFLGSQGYVWDTQTDMAMALIGSVVAQMSLFRVHDRQIEALRDVPTVD